MSAGQAGGLAAAGGLEVRGTGPAAFGRGWEVPAAGLYVYIAFFLAGQLFDMPFLNVAGSSLLLYVLLLGNHKRMFALSGDKTVVICLLLIAMAFVNLFINRGLTEPGYFLKFITMCFLYVLVFSYGYSPMYDSEKRKYLLWGVLLVLALSLIAGRKFEHYGEVRSSGIFSNPNNLALIALSLLLFINEEKDRLPARLLAHALVLFILAASATSGALLAYLAALAYKNRGRIFRIKPLLAGFCCLAALAPVLLYSRNPEDFPALKKITSQLAVIRIYLPRVIWMERLDYGRILARYGASSLSGIWRVEHWFDGLYLIGKSGPLHLLFGNGIGSSATLLGNLPHNEYLRVLLEQGLTGFALVAAFFFAVAGRIDKRYMHILVMFGIFCFTENNLDNFLFMTLFIFFIATAQTRKEQKR